MYGWGVGGSMFQLNLKRRIYKLLDVRPGKEFLGVKYRISNMRSQFKFVFVFSNVNFM